jgi:hypothetical protein
MTNFIKYDFPYLYQKKISRVKDIFEKQLIPAVQLASVKLMR